MQVQIIRSTRRRKTVGMRQVGETLRVYLPVWMSRADEQEWVARAVERCTRPGAAARRFKSSPELLERAGELWRRYLPGDFPDFSIRYVTNQHSRYGSCTPQNGTIRISDRLRRAPEWVRDYVIVHEVAHLLEANHTRRFWELVRRYPRADEARAYLLEHAM